jgi:hypothetical protein
VRVLISDSDELMRAPGDSSSSGQFINGQFIKWTVHQAPKMGQFIKSLKVDSSSTGQFINSLKWDISSTFIL